MIRVVIGMGKDFAPASAESVGAAAAARLLTSGEKTATIVVQGPKDLSAEDDARAAYTTALALSSAVVAQTQQGAARIGFVGPTSASSDPRAMAAFTP